MSRRAAGPGVARPRPAARRCQRASKGRAPPAPAGGETGQAAGSRVARGHAPGDEPLAQVRRGLQLAPGPRRGIAQPGQFRVEPGRERLQRPGPSHLRLTVHNYLLSVRDRVQDDLTEAPPHRAGTARTIPPCMAAAIALGSIISSTAICPRVKRHATSIVLPTSGGSGTP